MAPPEQTQVGDDESGDAADVASTQTTQGTLPDVGRLVAMCPFCHAPDMQAAANECFQCGSPIQLPDTALADAPVERLNVSRLLGAVDKDLYMLEANTVHLKYCIDQYTKDEARIQAVHDNTRRIMHATDRDLSRFGTEVMERVLRLERLRRRFEDEIECPRKRRRLIADTPPGENVAHAQACLSSRSTVDHGGPVSPAAEEPNRPVDVLDADWVDTALADTALADK